MEFRVHDEEDYKNTIAFLEMEKKMDAENFKEILKIEPSHLNKTKITAMGKLGSQWEKQSNSLIKSYKEQQKSKSFYERVSTLEREKTWFIT